MANLLVSNTDDEETQRSEAILSDLALRQEKGDLHNFVDFFSSHSLPVARKSKDKSSKEEDTISLSSSSSSSVNSSKDGDDHTSNMSVYCSLKSSSLNKNESAAEATKQQPDIDSSSTTGISLVSDKLKLQSIVEAVGFILFPSSGFFNLAFKELLVETGLFDSFQKIFKTEFKRIFDDSSSNESGSARFAPLCEELLNKFLIHLLNVRNDDNKNNKSTTTLSFSSLSLKTMQKRLGYLYFKHMCEEYDKPLRSFGSTMYSFYNNLNSLHESLISHSQFGPRFLYLHKSYAGYTPSFRCEHVSPTEFTLYTIQERVTPFMHNFYYGLVDASANLIWNIRVKIDKMKSSTLPKTSPYILAYRVRLSDSSTVATAANFLISGNDLSRKPKDLCVSLEVFKTTFPFTVVIDRQLNIKQMGDSFVKYLGQLITSNGFGFLTYFEIVHPSLNEYSFESLLLNHNMSYRLRMRPVAASSQFKDMELKGSLVYLEESDCLMFIGSPVIQRLEELTGRGLYISDIPIHDATRDIILVGEQTKAQEGLKFRMEKLKQSIVKAHEDIEEEKQKNIELLNLIFPSEIAKKLWHGERVQASSITNVTLLYSDIVGFTSICSTAQPIEVIEMLKKLYTDFDHYCGLVDIYKIETIGDAYLLAGGLHKPSTTHAQQIAWMSLLMVEMSSRNYTPKGDRIKMRVGLHSGEVLAGIVGIKQPRYCLFGNNCTIANKFESMGIEQRIHVSPVTKRLLEQMEGFEFEPRSKEFLPENWFTANYAREDDVSWFMNTYRHMNVVDHTPGVYDCFQHVQAALVHYKFISEQYKFVPTSSEKINNFLI